MYEDDWHGDEEIRRFGADIEVTPEELELEWALRDAPFELEDDVHSGVNLYHVEGGVGVYLCTITANTSSLIDLMTTIRAFLNRR